VAGVYERMVPDAEAVRIMREVLGELQLGEFVIKVRHPHRECE
jgi:histidyl-tRNA synthetase